MNIDLYLDRIHAQPPQIPDLSSLRTLQTQHVLHVVFENLDILYQIPLSMEVDEQFQKVIINGRGGVCYELNLLFHHLLQSLGYDIQLIAGTVHGGQDWAPIEDTHMTNLVSIDSQPFVVDVGFGGNSPREPVPISGEPVWDSEGFYQVKHVDSHPNHYILDKQTDHGRQILYRFSLDGKQVADFTDKCEFAQYSPHSPFNKGTFLSRVTQTGRITLTDHSLTILEGKKKRKQLIQENQITQTIQKYFDRSI